MGEVMITRRGTLGGDDEHFGQKRHFKKFIRSVNWIVPNNAINNEFNVICFGHGYAGSDCYSGFLNNGKISLVPGEKIFVDIDSDVSFGKYLLANGGSRWDGGSGGSGCSGQQFGGGCAGDGGVWGGGGANGIHDSYKVPGNGGMYGGGGSRFNINYPEKGKGGKYGGNGGYNTYNITRPINIGNYNRFIKNVDLNFYRKYLNELTTDIIENSNYNFGENGTNTIGWTNVDKDINTGEYITGPGLAKTTMKKMLAIKQEYQDNTRCRVSFQTEIIGGGGFGGCSIGGFSNLYDDLGNPKSWISDIKYINDGVNSGYLVIYKSENVLAQLEPGGGGYGGNAYGSGGGGYGKGADSYAYGGAGYFTPSIHGEAAGWGLYGSADEYQSEQGICTVEYYTWE